MTSANRAACTSSHIVSTVVYNTLSKYRSMKTGLHYFWKTPINVQYLRTNFVLNYYEPRVCWFPFQPMTTTDDQLKKGTKSLKSAAVVFGWNDKKEENAHYGSAYL